MAKQPLAEVFGYPIDNQSKDAVRNRSNRFCRFHNRGPNCTKDKATDPLGVCSVLHNDHTVITCPIRFRERSIIQEDAAKFFFPPDRKWTTLTEVRLKDAAKNSVGNIDFVLISYDGYGRAQDFGALEIQAVYISGNIRDPFRCYMSAPGQNSDMSWADSKSFPRPDFLSSSRKRLVPQLLSKGGILNAWGKKIAVAMDRPFYETLPSFPESPCECAEIAWLIYELVLDPNAHEYRLERHRVIYTKFHDSLRVFTAPQAGSIDEFMKDLQKKLDKDLEANRKTPPTTQDLRGFL